MKRLLLALGLLLASSIALAAVNINTATREELDALPGIGPVKAQAIIEYRAANGPFKTPADIMKVKGIKDGEFAKIKDEITVSGRTTVPAATATPAPAAAPAKAAPPVTAATPAPTPAPASKATAPATTAAAPSAPVTPAPTPAAKAKSAQDDAAMEEVDLLWK